MVRLLVLLLILTCAVLGAGASSRANDTESKGAGSKGNAVSEKGITVVKFDDEAADDAPKAFVPVVGNWRLAKDGDNQVFVVDGSQWSRGQTAAGIADRARSLYGEQYAEFLDNVKAFAYYPYAIAAACDDFQQGEITMRFKTIAGKIDQGAGILFNLKPNGDYLALRANPLESNLVLWKFERGVRSSVEGVNDTPTTSREWHELKLVVAGKEVKGYIDDKHLLTHTLPDTVSGRVGIWSKADSVVYFDDYTIRPALP